MLRFPIRAEENSDKFIIAIFGDSIARSIGHFFQVNSVNNPEKQLAERLRQIPYAQGKQIVILNLALGGHKQPQEMMNLAYLLAGGSKIDLVLYFASVNEPLATQANVKHGIDPNYPDGDVWVSMTQSLEGSGEASFSSLLGLYAWRAASRTEESSGRCKIASCVMVHRSLLQFERALSTWLLPPRTSTRESPHFVTFPAPLGEPARTESAEASTRNWQNACAIVASLAKSRGSRYLQILLPTPWARDDTALSIPADSPTWEFYLRSVPGFLAAMSRATEELQGVSIHTLDATDVLKAKSFSEPGLFLDASGHIGETGVELLVNYTIDQMIHLEDSLAKANSRRSR